MKKTEKKLRFADFPKEYRELCDLHLPRPIHDKVGCDNSLEIAEAMAGFEDQFTRDQADYFELVTDLILTYEEELEKSLSEKEPPFRRRLQSLLDSVGWTASDLGRFLGLDATMGNKIAR